MGSRVKSFFGGRTRAQKWAEIDAQNAQAEQRRAAEEESQRVRAERAASGRLMRGAGRRQLTWQGNEAGLAPTLGG
jgi:hypothetical protein